MDNNEWFGTYLEQNLTAVTDATTVISQGKKPIEIFEEMVRLALRENENWEFRKMLLDIATEIDGEKLVPHQKLKRCFDVMTSDDDGATDLLRAEIRVGNDCMTVAYDKFEEVTNGK